MDPNDARDVPSADPRLAMLESAPTPALLIGADGAIAWSNSAGVALGAGDRLDPPSARAVAGLGRAGLLRLRIGAAGRFEPIGFKGRRVDVGAAGSFVLLEALLVPARLNWATPRSPKIIASDVSQMEAGASVEGAPAAASGSVAADVPVFVNDRESATAPKVEVDVAHEIQDDRPPDPRWDMSATPSSGGDEMAVSTAQIADAEGAVPDAEITPTPPPPARFVFEIDGDGRVSFLSPDLAEAVGASAPQAIGRKWSDVANDLGLDPSGAVQAAIDRRSGWSGLAVNWPGSDGRRISFALSAIPVFDRGRTFVGFRGLGSSIGAPGPEAVFDRPDACASEASGPGVPVTPAGDQFVMDVEQEETLQAPLAQEAPNDRHEPPALFAAEPERDVYTGNVVAFRDGLAPLRPVEEPTPVLSRVEESAFDEIARRLKGVGEPLSDASTAREVWEDIAADAEIAIDLDRPMPAVATPQPSTEISGSTDDLRRLLDRIPLGAIVMKAGDVVYGNRTALDMSGYPDVDSLAERGAAKLFSEPLAPDDAAPISMKLISRDGTEVDVEARLAPVHWGSGPATAIVLKRSEGATAALVAAHAREAELSAILDTATDGVLTLDGAGRILSINRSAEALFGYDAREIVGSLFSLALAPESRRVAYEYLDGLKSSTVASLLNDGREVLGLVRQGGAIPLYMTLGSLGSSDDVRYCAVLRDITHWKKAEEELVAAKRQAERASAQKSDFLAKVSHEIRTPLNAIIGFAEVMIEERFGAVGNDRYKDYLKDIHLSGEHLISLVNDLLDLSKIESGKLELTFVDADLNELVGQAVALLQPQANRAHIIIRTSLARSLPLVRADKRSIRQIVLNLASNAVKFTQGGGQVIVATALNDLGDPVIRVRDTGVGMSRKEVALALEPFRQLPIGGSDGAGLGLPLTKALTEANLATFAIQSAVGEGTLVEVTFSSIKAGAI